MTSVARLCPCHGQRRALPRAAQRCLALPRAAHSLPLAARPAAIKLRQARPRSAPPQPRNYLLPHPRPFLCSSFCCCPPLPSSSQDLPPNKRTLPPSSTGSAPQNFASVARQQAVPSHGLASSLLASRPSASSTAGRFISVAPSSIFSQLLPAVVPSTGPPGAPFQSDEGPVPGLRTHSLAHTCARCMLLGLLGGSLAIGRRPRLPCLSAAHFQSVFVGRRLLPSFARPRKACLPQPPGHPFHHPPTAAIGLIIESRAERRISCTRCH